MNGFFIASDKFKGPVKNYVFKTGEYGLGYYFDEVQVKNEVNKIRASEGPTFSQYYKSSYDQKF